ncbi:MAG: DNA polymerase III subunit beta [Brevinema sp.]
MKFSVNKDEFLKALVTADSIINPRTPLSILLNVYLEVHNDGQLILLSYNGEHGVKIETQVNVSEAGKISLLSKKLLEIVRNIPSDTIIFEQKEGQLEVVIAPEGQKHPIFRLHGVSADTYPTFKEFNWDSYIRLNQGTLRELINSTEFAVSTDAAQIAFTGTYIRESAEGLISFVTTDGKRLAVITKPYEEKVGEVASELIVPQRIMKTLSDTLTSGDALFSVRDGQAFFKIDKVYVFSNLVEGKFPNYRDVIPSQSAHILTLDASALSSSLQRIAIMSDNDSGKLKLDIASDGLTISGAIVHGDAKDIIEVEYSGEPVSVAVNHRSITDFLKVVQGKKVLLSVNSSTSPILMMPAGDSDYEYITMPMKV